MNDRQRQIDKIRKTSKSFLHLVKRLWKKVNKRRNLQRNFETYDIHENSFNNFDAIQKSQKSGCFYCGRIFSASKIKEYTSSEHTAFCPYCTMDSVVQDYNVKITPHFLRKMNAEWFGGLGRNQR